VKAGVFMDVLTLGWRFFSLPWIHRLSQVNWFGLHLYWGKGTILRAFCSSALLQIYQTLYLFFRMQKCSLQLPLKKQECRFITPSQDAGIIVLSMVGMGYSLICFRSPDLTQ
jgi:hypothetical protein